MEDSERDLREVVATGCRVLGENGHDDFIWGHASVRDPSGRGAWLKAAGIGLTEVTPSNVHLVDRSGELIEGDGSLHVEYPIHLEIMAAHPRVGAVVHSHPPYSIALGASGVDLLPVSHPGTLFAAGLSRFDETGDLIVTADLGQRLAQALGDADAMLMVNHGIVTVGTDLPSAVVRAIVLEHACRHQLLTSSFGGKMQWSSPEEAQAKLARIWPDPQIALVWDYLVRQLSNTP